MRAATRLLTVLVSLLGSAVRAHAQPHIGMIGRTPCAAQGLGWVIRLALVVAVALAIACGTAAPPDQGQKPAATDCRSTPDKGLYFRDTSLGGQEVLDGYARFLEGGPPLWCGDSSEAYRLVWMGRMTPLGS
jgi:hypothetical protein